MEGEWIESSSLIFRRRIFWVIRWIVSISQEIGFSRADGLNFFFKRRGEKFYDEINSRNVEVNQRFG